MSFNRNYSIRDFALSSCIALAAGGAVSTLCAQNPYAETLRSIAASNRSLQALDLATEATKTENMSGLNLSNPQVDFAYQWGIENADKVILDVSQEFDFATLSGAKKEAARSDNRVADAALLGERMRVLAEADLLMTEVVYLNKLDNLYSRMVENARKQVEVLQKGLAEGSVTAVDLNSAKMELASLKGERQVNAVDLANARMRLGAMAGGTISWHGDAYMPYEMPADLSAYTGEATSRDPEVMKAREEIAAAASQEKLRRREGLPGFSLGYTSEMMRDDNHYGVSVGVSLPLWGNHGRVKAAKAARVAAEAAAEDARFQSEMRLRGCWQKAMALRDVADECRVLSRECDNTADIEKLYKLGQLSAQDYLAQLGSLMSLERRVIDADYAWQQALAEFRAAGAAY